MPNTVDLLNLKIDLADPAEASRSTPPGIQRMSASSSKKLDKRCSVR